MESHDNIQRSCIKDIFIEFQESNNADKTIKSKRRVEAGAMKHGILITM